MFGFRVLIVLTTCLSWGYCKLDKYCSICEDHTMCKYNGIGKDCQNDGGSGVSKEEKKEIVDTHNWVRRVVALGHETRGSGGPQPKAANLMKFIWDEELSKVAQRWADQCRFQHDTCRDDPRWKVGQNIYWKWKYPKHQVNWTEAILSWYSEVTIYDAKDVDSYRFKSDTGHYTQLLWHDTYTIGCGRRDYGPNKLYVCNYGPAGNWIGESLYDVGEPCSKCPQGTFCDEGLCALKPINGIRKEAEGLDVNSLRILNAEETSGGSQTKEAQNLETLTPPSENAKDIYTSENAPIAENGTHGLVREGEPAQKAVNDVLLDNENGPKSTTDSIENEIVLDLETKKEIEDIKIRIEELMKKVFRKLKGKN